MTMEEAYSQWLAAGEWFRAGDSRGWEGVASATWRAAYAAGQKAERAEVEKALVMAAADLRSDTHPDAALSARLYLRAAKIVRNRGEE